MKVVLVRTPAGLHGATPDDQEQWGKFRRRLETMPVGTYLRLDYSTPRNGPHHRKLMALLHLVAENSETWDTVAKALVAVKLCVGFFEPHVDPATGEITKVPLSIAFDAMGQEDFDAFYRDALDAILRQILPHMDQATAERLLEMIVLGWA